MDTNSPNKREEALKDVKLYMANGWDIKEETPEQFILKRNESTALGHVIVFVLTVWFSLGLGNLIYHMASNKTKKILK